MDRHSQSLLDSTLINSDLAPTRSQDRTWGLWHVASLWVGMSVCIPTYLLASSMVKSGMNWWQSLLAIFLGNAIVLVPLVLNAHAGTRYGIPFPVLARAAFGVNGAHLPSLLRSLVACGWFGIQTWIGGTAINAMLEICWAGWGQLGGDFRFMDYGLPHFLSFFLFWFINIYFVWAGTESIKILEVVAAPFLLLVSVFLLFWAVAKVGGWGLLFTQSTALVEPAQTVSSAEFVWRIFLPWLTAMVGYWATLSLNIPDFSRYARSQKDQMLGQALGLLPTMLLFTFVSVAVTTATVLLYGEAVWNPIDLLQRVVEEQQSPLLGLGALLVVVVATLSTNIAANLVAPANSFSNLSPSRLSFRLGGLVAGVVGILILPWKLLEFYQSWLIGYSGLLGAVGGILLCDYYLIRRCRLPVLELYRRRGSFYYCRGFNRAALLALGVGIVVALAGHLHPGLEFLFNGAWFFSTGVSFLVYAWLMKSRRVAADPV